MNTSIMNCVAGQRSDIQVKKKNIIYYGGGISY